MHIFALVGGVENRMVGVDIVTRPGGSRGGQKTPFLGVFGGPKGPEQSPPEEALGGLFSGVSGGSSKTLREVLFRGLGEASGEAWVGV